MYDSMRESAQSGPHNQGFMNGMQQALSALGIDLDIFQTLLPQLSLTTIQEICQYGAQETRNRSVFLRLSDQSQPLAAEGVEAQETERRERRKSYSPCLCTTITAGIKIRTQQLA